MPPAVAAEEEAAEGAQAAEGQVAGAPAGG
jgi:hypothetical protein